MNISVQTLRHYSNMELLTPEYIDPETGYRYYSFNQLHYIDRIKYLRSLGVPLANIKDALQDGSPSKLVPHLYEQKEQLLNELNEIKEAISDVNWYIDYFEYIYNNNFANVPYIKTLPERYAFATYFGEDEDVQSVEMRLASMRNDEAVSHFRYRRQYGYTADFSRLIQKDFYPLKYFMHLKKMPESIPEKYKNNLLVFPEGEYICFKGRVRAEDWDPTFIGEMFKNKKTPELVIANEYEDSLISYKNCPYEIQILIH